MVARSNYYEAVKINVHTPGNYSIRSISALDTFGSLYNDTFDPTYPSLNLLQSNDDGAGSSQFFLSLVLQTMIDYILVATTFSPMETGEFSIIVQGPATVNFTLTNATGQYQNDTPERMRIAKSSLQDRYTDTPFSFLIHSSLSGILGVL